MEFEFQDKQKDRRSQMSQQTSGNLVDTTDCLEAIGVFRCWKNFLFIVVLLCLLLLQGAFWVTSRGYVETNQQAVCDASAAAGTDANTVGEAPAVTSDIKKAAKQAVADTNQPAKAEQQQQAKHWFTPRPKHIRALVSIVNFILIPAACLYCLTMLFALKVSMIGRLGGINHIARAFFLSLIFFVLLLPWQVLFAPMFKGVMFTACELQSACNVADKGIVHTTLLYSRFTGYWLIALLLLLCAQIRSMRWARATLKRLEVV
jgi:hypothetical protein